MKLIVTVTVICLVVAVVLAQPHSKKHHEKHQERHHEKHQERHHENRHAKKHHAKRDGGDGSPQPGQDTTPIILTEPPADPATQIPDTPSDNPALPPGTQPPPTLPA